jgi:hypothetical protein
MKVAMNLSPETLYYDHIYNILTFVPTNKITINRIPEDDERYEILKTIQLKTYDDYDETCFVDLFINENKYCRLSFDNIYPETLYKPVPIISLSLYEYYNETDYLLTDLNIIHI